MEPEPKPGAIFAAIQSVMRDIEAIPKERKNQHQGFMFRGIDEVYNSLHPILAKHGVFSTSTILHRAYSESTSKSGTAMVERILSIRYRFYATDGSFVDTEVDGEAMDSGDKTSNKAMAIAHKYALIQLFCIPTADEKDPDAESPARAPVARDAAPAARPATSSTGGGKCPDCGGATETLTSGPKSKYPGRDYERCPSCAGVNGRPGKFLRWSDSKPRTPNPAAEPEPAVANDDLPF